VSEEQYAGGVNVVTRACGGMMHSKSGAAGLQRGGGELMCDIISRLLFEVFIEAARQ
jgi:hypothetical protein